MRFAPIGTTIQTQNVRSLKKHETIEDRKDENEAREQSSSSHMEERDDQGSGQRDDYDSTSDGREDVDDIVQTRSPTEERRGTFDGNSLDKELERSIFSGTIDGHGELEDLLSSNGFEQSLFHRLERDQFWKGIGEFLVGTSTEEDDLSSLGSGGTYSEKAFIAQNGHNHG